VGANKVFVLVLPFWEKYRLRHDTWPLWKPQAKTSVLLENNQDKRTSPRETNEQKRIHGLVSPESDLLFMVYISALLFQSLGLGSFRIDC
jgi:hypothetical protein